MHLPAVDPGWSRPSGPPCSHEVLLTVFRHVCGYLDLRELVALAVSSRTLWLSFTSHGIEYPHLNIYERLDYHVSNTVAPYLVPLSAISADKPSFKGSVTTESGTAIRVARTPYSTHAGGFAEETHAQRLRLHLTGGGSRSDIVGEGWLSAPLNIQRLWLSRLRNVEHLRIDIDFAGHHGIDPESLALLLRQNSETLRSVYVFWRPPALSGTRGKSLSQYFYDCWDRVANVRPYERCHTSGSLRQADAPCHLASLHLPTCSCLSLLPPAGRSGSVDETQHLRPTTASHGTPVASSVARSIESDTQRATWSLQDGVSISQAQQVLHTDRVSCCTASSFVELPSHSCVIRFVVRHRGPRVVFPWTRFRKQNNTRRRPVVRCQRRALHGRRDGPSSPQRAPQEKGVTGSSCDETGLGRSEPTRGCETAVGWEAKNTDHVKRPSGSGSINELLIHHLNNNVADVRVPPASDSPPSSQTAEPAANGSTAARRSGDSPTTALQTEQCCVTSGEERSQGISSAASIKAVSLRYVETLSIQLGQQYASEFFFPLRVPNCTRLLLEEWEPFYDPQDGLLPGVAPRAKRQQLRKVALEKQRLQQRAFYNIDKAAYNENNEISTWPSSCATTPLFEGEHLTFWMPLVCSPEHLVEAHIFLGSPCCFSRKHLRLVVASLQTLYYALIRFHGTTLQRVSCSAPDIFSQAMLLNDQISSSSGFLMHLREVECESAGLLLHEFAVNTLLRYPRIVWKASHVVCHGYSKPETSGAASEDEERLKKGASRFRPADPYAAALLERWLLLTLEPRIRCLTLGAISEAFSWTFTKAAERARRTVSVVSKSPSSTNALSLDDGHWEAESATPSSDDHRKRGDIVGEWSSVDMLSTATPSFSQTALSTVSVMGSTGMTSARWFHGASATADWWWPLRGEHYYDASLAIGNIQRRKLILFKDEADYQLFQSDCVAFLSARLPRTLELYNCVRVDLVSYHPRLQPDKADTENAERFYTRMGVILTNTIFGTPGKRQNPSTRSKTRLRVRAGTECPAKLLELLPKYHLDIIKDTSLLASVLDNVKARSQLRGIAGPLEHVKEALQLMYAKLYQWNRPDLKMVEVWVSHLMIRPLAAVARIVKSLAAYRHVTEIRVLPVRVPKFLTLYDVFGPKSPEADLLRQIVRVQYFHRDLVAETEVWGLYQQPMFVFTRPAGFRFRLKQWRLNSTYGVKSLPPQVEE